MDTTAVAVMHCGQVAGQGALTMLQLVAVWLHSECSLSAQVKSELCVCCVQVCLPCTNVVEKLVHGLHVQATHRRCTHTAYANMRAVTSSRCTHHMVEEQHVTQLVAPTLLS